MTRFNLIILAAALGLGACATTVTPENAATFSDLSLCRIQANPGSREPAEMSLVFGEIERRDTDCQAVFDEERRRQEELRRIAEEERRIAEEERRIRTERQIERIANAADALERPGSWRNRPVPPNTSGYAPNICLRNEENGRLRPADAEAVMGDALNFALRTGEFHGYRQYVVVFRRNGNLTIIELNRALDGPDAYPYGFVQGVDEAGRTFAVSSFDDRNC